LPAPVADSMKTRPSVFALFLFLLGFCFQFFTAAGQEIPLKRIDQNTYSFSTRNLHFIRNFELDGPSYHITDDLYPLEIRALTKEGKVDSTITGNYVFAINKKPFEMAFNKGITTTEIALEPKQNMITLQLANTNLEKSIEITRLQGWPKVVLLLSFLLLTFAFRHQLSRAFRKLTGKKKY
jgi:hypothetical protein